MPEDDKLTLWLTRDKSPTSAVPELWQGDQPPELLSDGKHSGRYINRGDTRHWGEVDNIVLGGMLGPGGIRKFVEVELRHVNRVFHQR